MSIAVSLLAGPGEPESRTVIFPDKGGVIGRSPGCQLVLPEDVRSVSKRHAFIERVGDKLFVTDLSTNGTSTFGSSEPIGRGNTIEVEDGTRIQCADFTIELQLSEQEDSAGQAEPAAPPAEPASPPPPESDAQAIFQGLLEGLEIDAEQLDLGDPRAFGRRAGESLRHALATVAVAMRMRAHVKGSLNTDVTQLMPSQLNPLKISLNEVDALEAILGPAHAQFQDAASALRDVQNELREHELAVLEATRTAGRQLLEQLSPATLLERGEQKSSGLFANKHKFAWSVLIETHEGLQDPDLLDTLFGQAYAAALTRDN